MNALLDSNIIIDFFAGLDVAIKEVTSYERIFVSIITYIEVMVGIKSEEEMELARNFFQSVTIEGITSDIADMAIKFRSKSKMKLADSIILATAMARNILLVTRDEGIEFKDQPYVRFPYKI